MLDKCLNHIGYCLSNHLTNLLFTRGLGCNNLKCPALGLSLKKHLTSSALDCHKIRMNF